MKEGKVLVTGATGALGALIVKSLVEKIGTSRVIAGGRKAGKAQPLVDRGVEFRTVDYDSTDTIRSALQDVTRVVLVSGSEVGKRIPQHTRVIEECARAGVELVAYTSILRANESPLLLAAEHRGTEEALAASRVPWIALRHGWYTENTTGTAPLSIQLGVVQTCAGEGRYSTATRQDYAEGDARLILADNHTPGQRYELAGSTSFSRPEYAELLSRKSGRKVVCQQLSQADFTAALIGAGLPEPVARIIADSETGAGQGWLQDDSRTLEKVLGRPPKPLETVLDEVLESTKGKER